MGKYAGRSAPAAVMAVSACVIALSGCELSGNQAVGHVGRLAVAEQFLLNGNYDKAYALLDAVTEDRSQSAKVWLDVGDLYLRNTAFLKAERAYIKAGEAGDEVGSRLGLGRVSLARNDHADAVAHFDAVLQRDPQNARALNGLGVAADLRGAHFEAQQHYRRAYRMDSSNLDPLNNLGLSLILGGNADAGVSVLTDVARSNRDDAVTRQNLALAYALIGRRDDALRLARLDVGDTESIEMIEAVSNYRTTRN